MMISYHGDGSVHLLEATSARKVIKTSCSSNFLVRVAAGVAKSVEDY